MLNINSTAQYDSLFWEGFSDDELMCSQRIARAFLGCSLTLVHMYSWNEQNHHSVSNYFWIGLPQFPVILTSCLEGLLSSVHEPLLFSSVSSRTDIGSMHILWLLVACSYLLVFWIFWWHGDTLSPCFVVSVAHEFLIWLIVALAVLMGELGIVWAFAVTAIATSLIHCLPVPLRNKLF